MTTTQKTDLKKWKQDQSQPLPVSLENALVERCLEELKNSPKTRARFNKLGRNYLITLDNNNLDTVESFKREPDTYKVLFLIIVLSQEVMPFLAVDTNIEIGVTRNTGEINGKTIIVDEPLYLTLDHLLHQEFTEALRVGKTFDEAYKIINLMYCQNVGAPEYQEFLNHNK